MEQRKNKKDPISSSLEEHFLWSRQTITKRGNLVNPKRPFADLRHTSDQVIQTARFPVDKATAVVWEISHNMAICRQSAGGAEVWSSLWVSESCSVWTGISLSSSCWYCLWEELAVWARTLPLLGVRTEEQVPLVSSLLRPRPDCN